MDSLPAYISIVFFLVALAAVYFFYAASHRSKVVLIVLLLWAVIQLGISSTGFYLNNFTLPPRFILLVLPPALITIILFNIKGGKAFIDRFDPAKLTLIHLLRIPVELVLYWLFLYRLMPERMSFEGSNFDIISGVSAIFIYYFFFIRKSGATRVLLLWNVTCLLILATTVIQAVLSAPSPFQRFDFDQPSVAVLNFPFTLLPGLIVPLVYFSHFAVIRQCFLKLKEGSRE